MGYIGFQLETSGSAVPEPEIEIRECYALDKLEEFSYLLDRPGVWALLDTGASRCVGGALSLQRLSDLMFSQSYESTMLPEKPSFVFGNGERKAAMSTWLMYGHMGHMGDSIIPFTVSAMDADDPILVGMELLESQLQAVIDCGMGAVCLPRRRGDSLFPRVANPNVLMEMDKVYSCERMPGKHLAVNLADPRWRADQEVKIPDWLGKLLIVLQAKIPIGGRTHFVQWSRVSGKRYDRCVSASHEASCALGSMCVASIVDL